jgi:hypothetical protein
MVDSLLMELSGSPSRYDERLEAAREVLSLDDWVFAFLAWADQEAVGVAMMSECALIYAGSI